jgi:hypothetical protein
MTKARRLSPVLALLLLLAGCRGSTEVTRPTAPAPAATEAVSQPGPSATTSAQAPARRAPRAVVEDPASALLAVQVTRTATGGLRVATGWACVARGCPHDRAIAVSDDGFRTARYLRWNGPHGQRLLPGQGQRPTYPSTATGLGHLIPWTATSLADGVVGVVGGGDGATLFPFSRTARSTDGGDTFTTVDVPLTHGARAYGSGFVVLAHGRLLALLDHWSDDRSGRPGPGHHGLWVSDGDDWATYATAEPRFRPALGTAPRGFSPLVSLAASVPHGGVIWVQTWEDRVYVSTDSARTFREVRSR